MFEKITLTQLNDHVWLMDDAGEASGYIVVGNQKAAVIDTMNGSENLLAVVRTVTQLPVIVINTHGHPDHVGGNVFFEEAYLHPADIGIAERFLSESDFIDFLKRNNYRVPPFKAIKGGDLIDLGEKTLEIIDLPEHTPGGILILLREDRILFTGDSINRHLWMQLDHSLSIEELVSNLEKVMYLEMEADTILHGHAKGFEDISLMRKLLEGAKSLLAGKMEKDIPYKWFGGIAMQHPFDENSVICYRKDNIKKA